MSKTTKNLKTALEFLELVIQQRIEHHFRSEDFELDQLEPIKWSKKPSPLSAFCQEHKVSMAELIVVLLALAPHLDPAFLSNVIRTHLPQSGDFPEIGGQKDGQNRYFLPTGETALFLIAGKDLATRLEYLEVLTTDHWFHQKQIVTIGDVKAGESLTAGRLILDQEYVELFLMGKIVLPKMSTNFPAQHISTQLEWSDLILTPGTEREIRSVEIWIQHHQTLLQDWEMHKRLKPGYRALFYGPPGTGKTLAATLLGKHANKAVFRIDLSLVVSKYIGETEKNLAALFSKAEHKDWILFFDEADALFGKRTNVRDAHDKYANQEVSYLLQRIEAYPGLVILASNYKSNIDDAFMRRFQSVIFFPVPKAHDRLRIWQKAFPEKVDLSDDLDLQMIARKYEMTGSNIMNVVQVACLLALSQDRKTIQLDDVLHGIEREYAKEGKLH